MYHNFPKPRLTSSNCFFWPKRQTFNNYSNFLTIQKPQPAKVHQNSTKLFPFLSLFCTCAGNNLTEMLLCLKICSCLWRKRKMLMTQWEDSSRLGLGPDNWGQVKFILGLYCGMYLTFSPYYCQLSKNPRLCRTNFWNSSEPEPYNSFQRH